MNFVQPQSAKPSTDCNWNQQRSLRKWYVDQYEPYQSIKYLTQPGIRM